MAAEKSNKRGRPMRDPLQLLDGHVRGVDGNPVSPEKAIAPDDHKLFIMERTREIWSQLLLEQPDADEYDLHEKAMDQAGRELTKNLRSGKKLFPYIRQQGRPAGSGRDGSPDDATLRRDYQLVRPQINAAGAQYTAVARLLWVRKYKSAFQSVDALRMRLSRSMKKAEHK